MIFIRIEFACQGKEVVTQSIDVGNDIAIHFRTLLAQGENATFGTSANRAANMTQSRSPASTRKNETTERRKRGIEGIYLFFEVGDHLFRHQIARAHFLLTHISGEIATHHKELVLDVRQELAIMFVRAIGDEQSDLGTEFVNGPIGFESGTSLADPLPPNERSLSLIACSCVDFHRENELLEKVILFDTFFVENHHAPFPHVEGDDGAWVVDDEVPQVGILIVDVFDDEDGVGGG